MTHDYSKALEALKNGHIDNFDPNFDHLDAVESALRIADRLQRGNVSEGMRLASENRKDEMFDDNPPDATIWEAMAQQLVKEEQENDRT
jgi:hypothetical protein